VHIFRQTSDMVQLLLMRICVVMFSATNECNRTVVCELTHGVLLVLACDILVFISVGKLKLTDLSARSAVISFYTIRWSV
jgi:hypothetical protein